MCEKKDAHCTHRGADYPNFLREENLGQSPPCFPERRVLGPVEGRRGMA